MASLQIISSEGDDFTINVKPSCTILELKEFIDEEIGVGPSRQKLFYFGYPLTEEDALIQDFLSISNTFTVVLPEDGAKKDRTGKATEFISNKERFLITGGRLNFQAIRLQANEQEWIKLKSRRFGVARHVEGEETGKRIFQMRVYQVKTEGRIDMRTENGEEKVYLVIEEGPNGDEIELKPVDTKTYDESKRLTRPDIAGKLSNAITSWLSALGDLLSGGASIAEAV